MIEKSSNVIKGIRSISVGNHTLWIGLRLKHFLYSLALNFTISTKQGMETTHGR